MNRKLLILGIVLCTACTKDDYTGDPVLKYRLKEYTHKLYKYTYEYDSLNRLVKSRTDHNDSPLFNTNYFYANNKLDSLSKFTENFHEKYQTYKYNGDTIFQTTYLYWSDYKYTLKFVLSNNQVVQIINPLSQFVFQELHWDNNNLTNRFFYSDRGSYFPRYKSARNTSGTKMINVVSCTYDKQQNPLKFIKQQISPGEYESSDNNLLRMVVSNMDGDTLFRTFTHTYNENSFPIATTETQKYNKTRLDTLIPLTYPISLYKYVYEEYK